MKSALTIFITIVFRVPPSVATARGGGLGFSLPLLLKLG
jgi:hypothetical protein